MAKLEKILNFFNPRRDLDHINWEEYLTKMKREELSDSSKMIHADYTLIKEVLFNIPKHFVRGNVLAAPLGIYAAVSTTSNQYLDKAMLGLVICVIGELLDAKIYLGRVLFRHVRETE